MPRNPTPWPDLRAALATAIRERRGTFRGLAAATSTPLRTVEDRVGVGVLDPPIEWQRAARRWLRRVTSAPSRAEDDAAIIRLRAEGLSLRLIAERIGLSEGTVCRRVQALQGLCE